MNYRACDERQRMITLPTLVEIDYPTNRKIPCESRCISACPPFGGAEQQPEIRLLSQVAACHEAS